jgi:tripeptidyl-peptidase I
MLKCLSGLIFLVVFSTTCNCAPSASELLLKKTETFLGDGLRPATNSHVFKESMPTVSTRDDLKRLGRVSMDVVHEIVFVIRLRNMEGLTDVLHDVSNPESPNYGQHLTREQVTNMTINIESRDAVLHYLSTSGLVVKMVTSGGEFVIAQAPITVLEKFFKTEFYHFEMSSDSGHNRGFVRADVYSIPSALDMHVESVLNIVEVPNDAHIPILKPKTRSESFETSATGDTIRPADLKAFYNMSATAKGSSKSTQMVYAAVQQYYSPSDLTTFQTLMGSTVLSATSIGAHSSDFTCRLYPDSCLEANLDVQYIMSMSPGSATTFWYSDAGYTAWMVAVSNYVPLPLVISISYGYDEIYNTKAMSDAFNMIAIKLSVMGTTILVASGDDGANSRKVRGKKYSLCGYMPDFPSVNPYVTVVGATSVRYVTNLVIKSSLQTSIILLFLTSLFSFSLYHPSSHYRSHSLTSVRGLKRAPVRLWPRQIH